MKKARLINKSLIILLIISAIANAAFLLSIPADKKNSIIFGLSKYRIILLFLFLILIVGLIRLLLQASKKSESIIRKINAYAGKRYSLMTSFLFFVIIALLNWIAWYAPSYMLGDFQEELLRLLPIINWLLTFAFCLVVLLHLAAQDWRFSSIRIEKEILRKVLLIIGIIFVVFLAIIFGYPKLTDKLWEGRFGVPILVTQIVFAWFALSLAIYFSLIYEIKLPNFFIKNGDWILFIVIWLCAVFLWTNQPINFVQDTYSTAIEQHVRPMSPNYEIYPYKDSQTYFSISESIAIGQGIYRSIDKPLFVAFLGLSNWINHGDYLKMLNWQILFLALFPGIIYLLGRELCNRWVGLLASIFAILQEVNAIKLMDEFPVVSSKTLLSEPFVQVWTGLIALLFVITLKCREKSSQWYLFFICGGVLGLSALFRLNTLLIAPFLILVIMIQYFPKKRIVIKNSMVLLLGLLIVFTPWMICNTIKNNDPLAFVKTKVEGVIINKRYEGLLDKSSRKVEYPALDNNKSVSENDLIIPIETPDGNNQSGTEQVKKDKAWGGSNLGKLSISILSHFLNNITTSFSILPTSIIPQSLFHGARSQQFWDQDSANYYEHIHIDVIIANLVLISLGIFTLIRKQNMIGLVPIVEYISYYLSNSIALTSGNRFSQPVAWVIYFYYACGLITLSTGFIHFLGIKKKNNPVREKELRKTRSTDLRKKIKPLSIGVMLLIGSIPIIADLTPIDRYEFVTVEDIKSEIKKEFNQTDHMGVSGQEFEMIVANQSTYVTIGRVLFPVQLSLREYEVLYGKPEIEEEGDFFTFMFLDAESNTAKRMLFFPGTEKIEIANRADILMVGKGNEALLLCVVDKAYASQVKQYDLIKDLPLKCFSRSSMISTNFVD